MTTLAAAARGTDLGVGLHSRKHHLAKGALAKNLIHHVEREGGEREGGGAAQGRMGSSRRLAGAQTPRGAGAICSARFTRARHRTLSMSNESIVISMGSGLAPRKDMARWRDDMEDPMVVFAVLPSIWRASVGVCRDISIQRQGRGRGRRKEDKEEEEEEEEERKTTRRHWPPAARRRTLRLVSRMALTHFSRSSAVSV